MHFGVAGLDVWVRQTKARQVQRKSQQVKKPNPKPETSAKTAKDGRFRAPGEESGRQACPNRFFVLFGATSL